jgi:cell wall-associated NlpC family hydrolase
VTLHITRPHRSRLKRGLMTVAAVTGGVLLSFGLTNNAVASPSSSEITAQIDEKWNQIEPTLELYNKTDAEYQANLARAKDLEEKIRPLALQVDVAFTRVSQISNRYYMTGRAGTLDAVLATGSPATFADQLATLNYMAKQEQLQIKDVIDLKKKYDAEKKPLDELVANLEKQRNDLAQKKAQAEADIKNLDQLRVSLGAEDDSNFEPVACPQAYDGSQAAKAAKVACQQIGKPYVFNTAGAKTFDCSGLTMYSWAQVGNHSLTHYTKWQLSETKRVTRDQLKPGDLIFFFSDQHHMAMYVGNNWFVHAPHTGDHVRMAQLGNMPVSAYGRVT